MEIRDVTPLLRNLYRGLYYRPWFYHDYLITVLAYSGIPDVILLPIDGIYACPGEDLIRMESVAFSLPSSQEELAREMGGLPPETARCLGLAESLGAPRCRLRPHRQETGPLGVWSNFTS